LSYSGHDPFEIGVQIPFKLILLMGGQLHIWVQYGSWILHYSLQGLFGIIFFQRKLVEKHHLDLQCINLIDLGFFCWLIGDAWNLMSGTIFLTSICFAPNI
jgi:hypothetical protein